MIYLTSLFIRLDNGKGRRDIADCHQLHRTIMSAFVAMQSDTARKDQNILYRVMTDGGLRARVFVQSNAKPDLAAWEAKPHLVLEKRSGPGYLEIKNPREIFRSGRLLSFDLLTCPTKKTGGATKEQRLKGERANSRRVGLADSGSRIAWLQEKAQKGGFSLLSVSECGKQVVAGTKPGGMRITHSAVRFTGVLKIEDGLDFVETLEKGIGAGKAHGLGLLMVSRYNHY